MPVHVHTWEEATEYAHVNPHMCLSAYETIKEPWVLSLRLHLSYLLFFKKRSLTDLEVIRKARLAGH